MSARPSAVDILPGSRIVREGRRWRAEIHVGAGRWRTAATAIGTDPHTALNYAVEAAWLGILNAAAGESEAHRPAIPCGSARLGGYGVSGLVTPRLIRRCRR